MDAIAEIVDGKWNVNGKERGWTDSTPYYVVYYALRWIEGFDSVKKL